MVSPQRLAVGALALWVATVATVACSNGSFNGAEHGGFTGKDAGADPTNLLGAVTWVVAGEVREWTVRGQRIEVLLIVDSVLYERPYYYWLNKYETPSLPRGGIVALSIPEPSRSEDLTGQRVVVALQAAGTPADLGEGTRVVDGEPALVALLLFDDQWGLIEASGGYLDTYREVLALYPQPVSFDSVLALIQDAHVRLAFNNERAIAEAMIPPAELAATSGSPAPPATPGPLGEWRRMHGFEGGTAGQLVGVELDAWLSTPADRRQLPVIEEEVLPGSAGALGIGAWVEREVVLIPPAGFETTYTWVGIRFPDVGILGPFFVDEAVMISLSGMGPANRPIELIAWRPEVIEDLAAADVLATIPITSWGSGQVLWVSLGDDPTTLSLEWELLGHREAAVRSADLIESGTAD